MFFSPAFTANRGTSLINELSNLSLRTNLKCCLDVGDLNSYDGTAQTWRDLSGNGIDFYRGTGSGSDGADPTFNGTAGSESSSAYFSYDGGDWFTLAQANPSWVNAIHKDSAAFSFVQIVYANNIDNTKAVAGLGTLGDTGAGFVFGSGASSSLKMALDVFSASAQVLHIDSNTALTNNAWNLVGFSFNEAAGTGFFQVNGTTETFSGKTYTSPDTGNAPNSMRIGRDTETTGLADASGCRIADFAIWDRALTSAEMLSLYRMVKSKFGI